ncbi:MAG: hypothetical protein ABI333_02655 [bacterium]
MHVVCEKCAHEFELSEAAAADSGGAATCPSCGEETAIGPVPAGSTMPWHPGQGGDPPGPVEPPPVPLEDDSPPPVLSEDDSPPPVLSEDDSPPPVPLEDDSPPPVLSEDDSPPPVPVEEPEDDSEAADGMFEAAEEASESQSVTTGAPRERSVLFEIGAVAALGRRQQASARTGGGEPDASGLLDIRMLAHRIHEHEEELRHEHQVSFLAASSRSSAPVAFPSQAPALVPVDDSSSSKKGLLIAIIAFFLVAIAAVAILVYVYQGRSGDGGEKKRQASAAMAPMDEGMGPEGMGPEAMGSEAMTPEAMTPEAMTPEAMTPEAMTPESMTPEAMKPEPPKKLPRKLLRKHIKPVVAALQDKFAACKKDKKGRFKIHYTVEGKTGKVVKVQISGRKYRKSETGKCLAELFAKTQFPQFRRKKQSFTHRVRIK